MISVDMLTDCTRHDHYRLTGVQQHKKQTNKQTLLFQVMYKVSVPTLELTFYGKCISMNNNGFHFNLMFTSYVCTSFKRSFS